MRPVRDRINGVALYLTARTRHAPLFSFSVAIRQKRRPCLFVCFYSDYGKQDGRGVIIKINSSCRKTTRDMTTLERKWWDSATLYFMFQLQNVSLEQESNLSIHDEYISFKMAAILVSFCLPNNFSSPCCFVQGKKYFLIVVCRYIDFLVCYVRNYVKMRIFLSLNGISIFDHFIEISF